MTRAGARPMPRESHPGPARYARPVMEGRSDRRTLALVGLIAGLVLAFFALRTRGPGKAAPAPLAAETPPAEPEAPPAPEAAAPQAEEEAREAEA